MLTTYLKNAYRNLTKNLLFTTINLVGLGFSMAFGMFFILIIKSQLEFDKSHENANRIFRIITSNSASGSTDLYATSPFNILNKIKQYSFVEDVTYLSTAKTYLTKLSTKEIPLNIQFTNASFLSIFNFNYIYGGHNALNQNNSIVLTESKAHSLWGENNPIGKTLNIPGSGDYKVTAVVRSYQPSHFNFDALVYKDNISNQRRNDSNLDKWRNLEDGYTYVLTRPGYDIKGLNNALDSIINESKQFLSYKNNGKNTSYKFISQSLLEINPSKYSGMINEMNHGYDWSTIWAISALIFILILMASFNYNSLSLAKSISRAKEIGIRKINGAKRYQIFIQFMIEAALLTSLATILSFALFLIISNISFFHDFLNKIKIDISSILFIVSFALFTTLLSGFIPAWILSSFDPIKSLQRLNNNRIFKSNNIRKSIILVQFFISTTLITFLVITKRQISYEKTFNYGFNTKDLVCISTEGKNIETFVSEARKIATIKNITATSGIPMRRMSSGNCMMSLINKADSTPVYYYSVDKSFVSTLGIKIIAGTNFSGNMLSSQNESTVLLNESAIKALNFKSAEDAIGHIIKLDTNYVQIIGIYRDFINWNLKFGSMPFALRNIPSQYSEILVKIDSSNSLNSIAALGSVWHRVYPSKEFNYEFYESFMKWRIDHHNNDYFLLDLLTGLLLLIACLGLIGMAAYSVETRTKEMGIRKALGATSSSLIWVASRSFIKLLLYACIFGLPVGGILGNMLLSKYAHKTDLSIDIYLISISTILFIGITVVLTQTYRTSNVNPVKVIRSE